MRWGEVGWIVFLAGLPFSHLLNRSVDIWNGHTLYAHGCLVVLWAYSLILNKSTRPNWPLACWVVWVGALSLWLWTNSIVQHKIYSLPLLLGVFHCLSIILFYQAAVACWNAQTLDTLFLWMARVGVIVLAYCGLQLLSLDQFFDDLNPGPRKDLLVGTIGNPSHLGSYLACLLPLTLLRTGWRWKIVSAVVLSLVAYLLLVEKSLGGSLAATGALLWWGWHLARKWFWWLLAGLGILGMIALGRTEILSNHGRFDAWTAFYDIFRQRPITGFGPGFVMELSRSIEQGPLRQWRHTHMELFQVAIEQGLIGFSLVLWVLWDYWKTVWRLPKTKLVVACSGMMLAFTLNSLVNFPAHLWLTGSMGLTAYCGIKVIESGMPECPS